MAELYESIYLQTRCFVLAGAVQLNLMLAQNGNQCSHEYMYQAIKDKDADRAEQGIRKHIKSGCEVAKMICKVNEMHNNPG